jgi:hypothetical protein
MRTIQSFNRLISNDGNRRLGPKGRSFWEFWRVGMGGDHICQAILTLICVLAILLFSRIRPNAHADSALLQL